jgi:KDO2-lipid IV(A) lauroyltransferase
MRKFAPRYWLTWLGIGFLRILEPLPYSWQLRVGRTIGRIARVLPLAHVRIARRNIDLCLPELSAVEREKLLKRHFESLGIGVCETAVTWWSSNERVRSLAQIEGADHLHRALARGRGAILVGGHFTTIEIGTRILGTVVPLNVLFRATRDEVLSDFMSDHIARNAARAIKHDDIRTLVRALRENGAVWYAPDQSYRNKGAAMVPFFGIPAATTTSTSRLARMTGAAVLTYFPCAFPARRVTGLHRAGASEFSERRSGGRHRAFRIAAGGTDSRPSRAIPVDPSPLQGTERGLPELLRA